MSTAHLLSETPVPTLSVQEYLASTFEPDMDYVDGVLEERNLGEWEHGDLQSELVHLFRTMFPEWRCRASVECRLQVAPARFRVPDVLVLHPGQAASRIVRESPLICIEILSPEDRWRRVEDKLQDYVEMGVKHVWVIDPFSREAFTLNRSERVRVDDGVLRVQETPVRVDLKTVFAALDQAAQNPAE